MDGEPKKRAKRAKKSKRRAADNDRPAASSEMSEETAERITTAPDLAPSTQAIVDGLYDQVKVGFNLKKVKAGNVINLLTYVMAIVEKEKTLTGPEKKEVVMHLVERLLGEIPGDSEDTLALQTAVQLLLPPMIDTIVAATRGQLEINRDAAEPTSSWWRCFPCCS